MMEETKRKGLGRGLSALLEEDADDYATIDRLPSILLIERTNPEAA